METWLNYQMHANLYRDTILDTLIGHSTGTGTVLEVSKLDETGKPTADPQQTHNQDERISQMLELFQNTLSHIQRTGNKSARCSNVPFGAHKVEV
jgi:hypothetical protein